MTLAELLVKLTVDSSEYDKGINDSKSKFESLGTNLKKGVGVVGKLAAGAIGGATAAIAGFGAMSVKTGLSFDSAMSQVAATMGTTTESIGELRDFAQEMGAKTAFSATEAAEALNYMALAGYDSQQSMTMLPNVLNLAAAGAMDLATASDMVTDTQTALGLSMDETNQMVDQMAKASSKTNTSVSQLGEAMLQIGATARGVKGGTVELSTVLGVLADNSIKGAEGGTHLRNMLLSLQTPTKSGTEALKQLGMTYDDMYDSAGNMRALPDIFMQLQGAMEGMDQKSKDAIVSGIFNKTDLASANALIGTSAERWNELGVAIGNSTGAAGDMAEEQLNNLAGDVTKFMSALEGVQLKISDALSPALRGFVQEGTQGLSKITEMLGEGNLSGAVELAGQTIATMLGEALTKLPDLAGAGLSLLSGLASGIASAGPQVFAELSTTLSEGISVMMASAFGETSVVDQIVPMMASMATGMISAFDSFLPQFTTVATGIVNNIASGLATGIPTLLGQVLPMVMSFSETLRSNAGKMVDAGINLVLQLAQGIINSFPVILQTLPTIISNIAGIINDNAPKLLAAGVKLIVMLAKGIVSAIPTVVEEFPKIIKAIFDVWSAINWMSLGSKAITFIKNGLAIAKAELPNILKQAGTKAINTFKSINWASLGKSVITLLGNAIKNAGTIIPTILKTLGSKAIIAFKSINWVSVGSAIVRGIASGIRGAAGIIASAAVSAAKKAFNKAKSFLGINSPSKLFRDKIGKNISLGMAAGIEDKQRNVSKAILDFDKSVPTFDFSSAPFGSTPASAAPFGGNTDKRSFVFNITNNVSGAEDPDAFATALTRRIQLEMRTV